jgi:hypothetical protein
VRVGGLMPVGEGWVGSVIGHWGRETYVVWGIFPDGGYGVCAGCLGCGGVHLAEPCRCVGGEVSGLSVGCGSSWGFTCGGDVLARQLHGSHVSE